MKITKILSYPVYPPNGDEYLYVCRLLRQEIDPPSGSNDKLRFSGKFVYASPLRRSKECIDSLSAEIRYIEALREIPLELETFCTRDDFEKYKSTAVRKAFVDGFVSDKLLLSRKQLESDILKIEELSAGRPDAHFVSHTFRMKIIQLYYETEGMIFKEPGLIRELLPADRHMFDFGEMIEVPNKIT